MTKTKTSWINTDDKLPELNTPVLGFYRENSSTLVVTLRHLTEECYHCGHVTVEEGTIWSPVDELDSEYDTPDYWMTLPSVPSC